MAKSCILIGLVALHCLVFVSCANGAERAAQPRDINLGVSDFQCPPGNAIYPHPQCNLYYTCYGGQPTYLWQCQGTLLFDLTYNGCNWPEQTYCGNRTRPDQGVSEPTTLPSNTVTVPSAPTSAKPYICPEDGFFAYDSSRCVANFYTCLDGFPFTTNCPSYGVFEPVGRKCVSPSSSACRDGNLSTTSVVTTLVSTTSVATYSPTATISSTGSPSVVPTTSKSASTSASGTFVCPGNGNYPDPSSCSHYYTCDNGNAYRFMCPSGLVFNPNTGVCDWPSTVPSCNGKQ